ncbi:MmcQ/YjbR family DNA-binding protein [Williamsia maris]|uniref:DNA-binding protein, MmcQ/YjbR family n=1 Tax=Williamsia maris TaxID=72806 RepID=A0ABT1HG54_9NOCA|nr:MmcQ/YjbR family DNA-binding protein [Williamsia maris]MCP2177223.1 putative DNA-binding protein, MmcQ/YjbR family [Williamsia maris]
MPHPIMFSADDPTLARVREIALALPETTEVVAHGRPTFRCGKIFAYYGGSVKGGDMMDTSVLFKPDPTEATALAGDDRFFVPAYVGAYGWLGVDLSGAPDWDEVAELLDASFRLVAPAKVIRRLDEL